MSELEGKLLVPTEGVTDETIIRRGKTYRELLLMDCMISVTLLSIAHGGARLKLEVGKKGSKYNKLQALTQVVDLNVSDSMKFELDTEIKEA